MSTTYSTPGTYNITIPAGQTILVIDCAAGGGGTGATNGGTGGKGARVQAAVPVTPGETLTAIVGSVGGSGNGNGIAANGGTGGAKGGDGTGAGGGSTELRRGNARLIVAGAGGGGGSLSSTQGGGGGSGGYPSGSNGGPTTTDGPVYGYGGTQTAGGGSAGTGYSGTATAGGDSGANSQGLEYGGGGGGGWYGGGGGSGGAYANQARGEGGGGGSSYTQSAASQVTHTNGYQAGNGYLTVVNTPPNAPTLNSPGNGATIDLTVTNRFVWTANATTTGDAQSKYDLRYSSDGGNTWTTITASTTNGYSDIPANTFTAGSYQWQVRTYSSTGLVGPWSSSYFFTAATPPSPPTITAPTAGAIVQAMINATFTVTGSIDGSRWQVLGDTNGTANSTVLDPGQTITDNTVRSFTTQATLANHQDVHLQVAVVSQGIWSSWADVKVTVTYTPPPAPTGTLVGVVVDDGPEASAFRIDYTTPASSGSQPAVTSVQVLLSTDDGLTYTQIDSGLPASGSWMLWTPAAGVEYAFILVAVGANGVTSPSASIGDDPLIIDGDDGTNPDLVLEGGQL